MLIEQSARLWPRGRQVLFPEKNRQSLGPRTKVHARPARVRGRVRVYTKASYDAANIESRKISGMQGRIESLEKKAARRMAACGTLSALKISILRLKFFRNGTICNIVHVLKLRDLSL